MGQGPVVVGDEAMNGDEDLEIFIGQQDEFEENNQIRVPFLYSTRA